MAACASERRHEGYYMSPGVFLNTTNAMRINREEMFAPLTSVIKSSGYDEALATVNDTNFGLTSGIVTRSLARATHFRRNARTGVVTVNLPTAGTDYHVPFGGTGRQFLRSARTGQGRGRVLHHRQDRLHQRGERRTDADRLRCNTPTGRRRSSGRCAKAASTRCMSRSPTTRNFRETVLNFESGTAGSSNIPTLS